jgi:ferredoxin
LQIGVKSADNSQNRETWGIRRFGLGAEVLMAHSQRWSPLLSLPALTTLLLLSLGSVARAQVGQGEITGLVTDPSGALVPNAKVTLTSSATAESRDTLTTSAGIYRLVAVPVMGTYAISVQASGFKTVEVVGIVVSTGIVVTQDIHLEIGSTTQKLLVEAGADHIDTTDSSVSTLVDRRLWQSLPLETRTQNTFINILPGVVPDQFAGTTRGAAVNGVRPGMANYLLDGFDNNDQGQGGAGVGGLEGAPGAVTQLSPDAIQEYRVITNDFPAEYGKGGGFVNDTVLKSGSNGWHGSAFEYNRVQAFAANDFFSNAAGIKDRLVRNQFGGSAGGPIVKDKTFFYATYERHTIRQSSPITTTGSTQDFINFVRTGAFKTFMETAMPSGPGTTGGFCFANFGVTCAGAFSRSATLGPNFTKLLAKGPFPLASKNLTPTAAGAFTSNALGLGLFKQITYPVNVYGTVTVSDPSKLDQNKGSLKVDHKLNSKAQLSGTYAITDSFTQDVFRGSDGFIGAALLNPSRSQDLGVTLTYTFTPVLIDQFRVSYLRRFSNFPNAAGLQGIPSVVSEFDPLGVAFGNSFSQPRFFTDNQFQYQDGLTYVHGKHTFKAGGEYRRTRNGSSFQNFRNSFIGPWDVENMLTDGFFGDEADLVTFGKPVLGGIAVAHLPHGTPGSGPPVSFARSGIAAAWDPKFASLLELAEACDVPVRWSCRTGVCHTCMTGLIAGSIVYNPEPLERPAAGNVLVCCSQPNADLTLDL